MSLVKLQRWVPYSGTDAALTALNPVAHQSEIIVVVNNSGPGYRIKIGDGSTPYAGLPFFAGGGGSGDYLGLAETSTVPPTLSGDAYYLTTNHGTFTNLSGVVIPSTALFCIISYNSGTTTWTYSEILDSATLSTPTLDQVLGVGNISNNKPAIFNNGGGSPGAIIDPSAGFTYTDASGTFSANGTAGYISVGFTPIVIWGNIGGQGTLGVKNPANSFYSYIQSGSVTGNRLFSFPDQSGVIATNNATQKLTNKRDQVRYLSVANAPAPFINTDVCDTYALTAQTSNITSFTTNLTGTPDIDDQLHIIINVTAGAPTISWGASFESSSVTLPVSASTRIDCFFMWNSLTSKWRLASVF